MIAAETGLGTATPTPAPTATVTPTSTPVTVTPTPTVSVPVTRGMFLPSVMYGFTPTPAPTQTPSPTPPPTSNLVNGNFEKGHGTGWKEYSNYGYEIITADLPTRIAVAQWQLDRLVRWSAERGVGH
ncbi:MAG: hypothetical protein R3C44_09415 [Chloroflexota bacterium]